MQNTVNITLKISYLVWEIGKLLPDCNVMVSQQQQMSRETKSLNYQKEKKKEEFQSIMDQIHDEMMEIIQEKEHL